MHVRLHSVCSQNSDPKIQLFSDFTTKPQPTSHYYRRLWRTCREAWSRVPLDPGALWKDGPSFIWQHGRADTFEEPSSTLNFSTVCTSHVVCFPQCLKDNILRMTKLRKRKEERSKKSRIEHRAEDQKKRSVCTCFVIAYKISYLNLCINYNLGVGFSLLQEDVGEETTHCPQLWRGRMRRSGTLKNYRQSWNNTCVMELLCIMSHLRFWSLMVLMYSSEEKNANVVQPHTNVSLTVSVHWTRKNSSSHWRWRQ